MGGEDVNSNTPTTWNLVVFHPCSRPSHWRWVLWWHRSFFPKNWWDFPLHLFALLIFTWNHLTCWTTSNIWCFIPLWKTETSRRLEVTINVSSPITVHMSHLCVLGHSHQETPTLFSTILLSLMHSHNVNGNSSKGWQSLKEMWLSRNCEMFSLLMN